jgi:hypothetical protein
MKKIALLFLITMFLFASCDTSISNDSSVDDAPEASASEKSELMNALESTTLDTVDEDTFPILLPSESEQDSMANALGYITSDTDLFTNIKNDIENNGITSGKSYQISTANFSGSSIGSKSSSDTCLMKIDKYSTNFPSIDVDFLPSGTYTLKIEGSILVNNTKMLSLSVDASITTTGETTDPNDPELFLPTESPDRTYKLNKLIIELKMYENSNNKMKVSLNVSPTETLYVADFTLLANDIEAIIDDNLKDETVKTDEINNLIKTTIWGNENPFTFTITAKNRNGNYAKYQFTYDELVKLLVMNTDSDDLDSFDDLG